MSGVFMPLGGANEIGASSYYLEADNIRLLLDCGIRIHGDDLYPDYNCLLRKRLESFSQIDAVILSHAHYDHIGSLPFVSDKTSKSTSFFSTLITKDLTNLQLIDLNKQNNRFASEKIRDAQRLQAERAIDRIRPIPLMKKQALKNCSITIYPAGHMAGACMTYIETENYRILYTGDFSPKTISGINELRLEKHVKPDILIINATYGYREKTHIPNNYSDMLGSIVTHIKRGRNVLLDAGNIAKYLELFYVINNSSELSGINVYLSRESEKIADAFEGSGYKIYSERIKGYIEEKSGPHVLISRALNLSGYEVINTDLFSAHADYSDLKQFIIDRNPKYTFVVHAYPAGGTNNIIDELTYSKMLNGSINQCENCVQYRF